MNTPERSPKAERHLSTRQAFSRDAAELQEIHPNRMAAYHGTFRLGIFSVIEKEARSEATEILGGMFPPEELCFLETTPNIEDAHWELNDIANDPSWRFSD